MAGTSEGGKKAAAKNKAKDPDFYKKIGSMSWDDPERSRVIGFALNPEKARELGRKGGKKTKNEYHKKEEYEDPETISAILKEGAEEDNTL